VAVVVDHGSQPVQEPAEPVAAAMPVRPVEQIPVVVAAVNPPAPDKTVDPEL
jgi:hypothetical protein